MDIVIRFLGILAIAVSVALILRPGIMLAAFQFFKKGIRVYLAAVVRLALSIVFFLGARECDRPWLIIAIGVLLLLSGLLIFVMGLDRVRRILEWFLRQPIVFLRFVAASPLVFGLIIVYAA